MARDTGRRGAGGSEPQPVPRRTRRAWLDAACSRSKRRAADAANRRWCRCGSRRQVRGLMARSTPACSRRCSATAASRVSAGAPGDAGRGRRPRAAAWPGFRPTRSGRRRGWPTAPIAGRGPPCWTAGELLLEAAGGGRASTNRWIFRDPRSINAEPSGRSVAHGAGPRCAPLLATARPLTAARRSDGQVATARESGASEATSEPVDRRFGRKGSGIERGFRSNPRSGPDGFRGKGSGIERGFCAKPRSEPDRFAEKPRHKPRQKPRHPTGAREGNPRTPEPQKPPQPP